MALHRVCVEQASGVRAWVCACASDGLKASHGWVPTTLLLSISQRRREQTPASPDPYPSDPQRTKTGAEPVPAAKGRRIDDNGVTRSSPTRGLVKMSMVGGSHLPVPQYPVLLVLHKPPFS